MPRNRKSKNADEHRAIPGENHLEVHAKDVSEFEFLTLCQLLRRRNVGSAVTPCEDFLVTLLRSYSYGPLAPEDVAAELEEFKWKHETLIEGAKNVLREYPEAFKEVAAAA